MVAVAGSLNDGTAGLQEDSSFAALRQEVERFADIIFASTPSQREFWLGKTAKASRATIEEKYKALKPCMHGSDAHWVEKVGAPAQDRYCWVKGDLAFETLRQVVLEPVDRVRIGPTPPLGPSPGETMHSVKLNDAPFVITPELQLNPGLIAIIGSRGSGKTALMEFLAAGASALTSTAMDSSFLQRATDLLGDAAVEITWADDETHSATLHDPWGWSTNDAETAKVCYLSQQFVERLCSSAGLATELRREMERVVFEATEQSDRMQCDSFAELSNLLLAPAAENRSELEASIKAIGDSILKEDLLREQVPTQAEALETQTAQIEKLKKEMKDILPKDKQTHADRLVLLEAEYKRGESKVEGLRLPLGNQIAQESVATKCFVPRDAQGKIDQEVALEWVGIEDMSPSTIQSKVVFTDLSETVAKQSMRTFQGQTAGLCDFQNRLQSRVLIRTRQVRQQVSYCRFAPFVRSKCAFVRWLDSSKQLAYVYQSVNNVTVGNVSIHCRVSSSKGSQHDSCSWQRREIHIHMNCLILIFLVTR